MYSRPIEFESCGRHFSDHDGFHRTLLQFISFRCHLFSASSEESLQESLTDAKGKRATAVLV